MLAPTTGFYTPEAPVRLGANLPWTNVGVRLTHALTANDALKAAGLLWDVQLKKVVVNLGTDEHPRWVDFPKKRAMVRDHVQGTTEGTRFLGIGSPHYKILQNKDAFGFFDKIVQRQEAVYHSAGSLLGGRLVFIVAKLPEDVPVTDDALVESYVLLTNSHSGQRRFRMSYLPTLAQDGSILASPSRFSASLRHMGQSFEGRIAEVRRALGLLPSWVNSVGGSFKAMAARPASEAEIDAYLTAVFPKEKEENVAEIIRTSVKERVYEDRPRPSVWDVYTETADWVDTAGKAQKPAARLSSIWFGERAKRKDRAFIHAAKLAS